VFAQHDFEAVVSFEMGWRSHGIDIMTYPYDFGREELRALFTSLGYDYDNQVKQTEVYLEGGNAAQKQWRTACCNWRR